MQLIICEKPKVAEKIAYALADDGKPERKVKNSVAYYLLERNGMEIAVAPAVGHIYSLDEKSKSKGYPAFDIGWVPSYEADKESGYTRAYIKNIEELAAEADEFISACDYDIEGSLIGYNAIRFAAGGAVAKSKRMKFSALTQGDLVDAYEGRTALDLNNAQAGEARHMLDWFYGINLSRALMSAIRKRGIYKVMSIGRVQGPALSILVKKEKEIGAFKSTPYWQIFGMCKKTRFSHVKDRFLSEQEAKSALGSSREDSTVFSIEKKEFLQQAPSPFDLTSLQIEAYRQFHFNPSVTLSLAQSLYEASMISYPRTSSQKLPEKLNLPKIIMELAKNPTYAALSQKLVGAKLFKPSEGKKDDPAHPAIHPTGVNGSLGERETKLYDLIVRRFLATFAPSAKRESQKVVLSSGTQQYSTSGNRTIEQGWFEYYAPYMKLDEVTLPDFAPREAVKLTELKMEQKMTQPPKRYTPASIIAELERLDLGTKATRSVIIDTLAKRGYVEGKTSMTTTPFGISVYESLFKNVPEILDEELTRGIEIDLEKIQNSERSELQVVEQGKKLLQKVLVDFKAHEDGVGLELAQGFRKKEHEESLLGACAKCTGGMLRVIPSSGGRQFVGCTNYPNCKNIFPLPANAKIQSLEEKCPICTTPRIRVIRAGRKPFDMCIDPTCKTKENWGKPKPAAGASTQQAAASGTAQAPQNTQSSKASAPQSGQMANAQFPQANAAAAQATAATQKAFPNVQAVVKSIIASPNQQPQEGKAPSLAKAAKKAGAKATPKKAAKAKKQAGK